MSNISDSFLAGNQGLVRQSAGKPAGSALESEPALQLDLQSPYQHADQEKGRKALSVFREVPVCFRTNRQEIESSVSTEVVPISLPQKLLREKV